MDELVQRLATGSHPVIIGGPRPTSDELEKRIHDLGYVFIKFTETQGGTDLGVLVDRQATHLDQARFDQAAGVAHIEGTLTLNYVQVRCIADINLATLSGTGYLELPEASCP